MSKMSFGQEVLVWMLMAFFMIMGFYATYQYQSERSKRIGLEAELRECDWQKVYALNEMQKLYNKGLGGFVDSVLGYDTRDIDSVIGHDYSVDTIWVDSSKAEMKPVGAFPLDSAYLWRVHDSLEQVIRDFILDKIWETPEYMIDSSEMTE